MFLKPSDYIKVVLRELSRPTLDMMSRYIAAIDTRIKMFDDSIKTNSRKLDENSEVIKQNANFLFQIGKVLPRLADVETRKDQDATIERLTQALNTERGNQNAHYYVICPW